MRQTLLTIAAVWAQDEVLDLRSPQEVESYRSKGLIPFRDLVDDSPGPQFSCDRLVSLAAVAPREESLQVGGDGRECVRLVLHHRDQQAHGADDFGVSEPRARDADAARR